MSQESVEVVRWMLAAVAAGQPEQALEFFDPEIVVDATRNVINPGTYVGIDGLERQQADLDEGWKEIRLEPIEFVDAGDRIVTIFAGVEAGRRGGFELVIGFDRGIHAEALREHGADVVVSDPGELRVSTGAGGDR